jgi:hypothetical protein
MQAHVWSSTGDFFLKTVSVGLQADIPANSHSRLCSMGGISALVSAAH